MDYYDDLETRAPQAREAALFAALPKQIAHAKKHAPAFARMLADVDAKRITDRAALAALLWYASPRSSSCNAKRRHSAVWRLWS